MERLKPFLSFYGSKYRAAPKYPAPQHGKIVEPFAGSAGYSVLHHEHDVQLFDINPVLVGIWDYLIHISESSFRRLPAVVEHIDNHRICQEAKWLIGFWLNAATTTPCKQPSAWARQVKNIPFWSEPLRERIAYQLKYIRHWKVKLASWETIPQQTATWFVDPPYQNICGREYVHSAVDFKALGKWSRSISGQVIVCEQAGADWLPFKPFIKIQATPHLNRSKYSEEVIWEKCTIGKQVKSRRESA